MTLLAAEARLKTTSIRSLGFQVLLGAVFFSSPSYRAVKGPESVHTTRRLVSLECHCDVWTCQVVLLYNPCLNRVEHKAETGGLVGGGKPGEGEPVLSERESIYSIWRQNFIEADSKTLLVF